MLGGGLSAQMAIREAFSMVSRTVVSELKRGRPDRERPKPIIGPALSLAGKPLEPLPPVAHLAPPHKEDGCPACKLHTQMADARGLADWLALNAQPDGSLPHPEAGTLPLIQVTLQQAARQVQTLAASRPDLAPHAGELAAKISDAADRVPTDGEAGAADAMVLSENVTALWKESCGLVSQYWRPPTAADASSTLRLWYQDARRNDWDENTALARLQEVLSGGSGSGR